MCGGSLVAPKFVLTAAHCIRPRDYGEVQFVKLGYNRRDQEDDSTLTVNVKRVFEHPQYDAKARNADIGLIEMEDAVALSERILPICLPQKAVEPEWAVASGFGKTGFRRASSSSLLKASLQRFTQAECQAAIGRLATVTNDTMICYGHRTESRDTCNVSWTCTQERTGLHVSTIISG